MYKSNYFSILQLFMYYFAGLLRAKSFEKDANYAATWKKDEDAKGGGGGPRIVVGQEAMVSGGFITRYATDVSLSGDICIYSLRH
jgi:hypothetical protein